MRFNITIETLSKRCELLVDDDLNKVKFNGELLDCDITNLKLNILDLIKSWPERLVNTNIVDGIKYRVIYKNNNVNRTYIGINKLPNNFSEFYELITNLQ